MKRLRRPGMSNTKRLRRPGMSKATISSLSLVILLCMMATASIPAQEDERDALAHYRNGEYEEAVRVTLDEIEAMPRNMDSYTVLGWSLIALGRYEDALRYGRRALEVSRYDNRIIEIVGEAHYRLGNYVDALGYFEEYAAIAPEGRLIAQVYYFMGEIFMSFGEYHHADIAFTAALYLGDESAAWWSRLGLARESAGDFEFALEAYNRALELNSNLNEARDGRARVQDELSG